MLKYVTQEFQIYAQDFERLKTSILRLQERHGDFGSRAQCQVLFEEYVNGLGKARSNLDPRITERHRISAQALNIQPLIDIDEADLQILEAGIPRIMDRFGEALNDVEVRALFTVCKRILSDVRWNYGPPRETHRIDFDR